jgi:PAS domain S-box-containing protein
VNKAYADFFGTTSTELVGKPDPPHAPAGAYSGTAAADADRPARQVERRERKVVLPNGKRRWIQWSDRFLYDEEGKLAEVQAVGRDITAQKEAQLQLEYRTTVDQLIARISTSFIRSNPTEVDAEIVKALETVGRFAKADRAYVFYISRDGTRLVNTHLWQEPVLAPESADDSGLVELEPTARDLTELEELDELEDDGRQQFLDDIRREQMPWSWKRLKSNEPIRRDRGNELPETSEADRALFEQLELATWMWVPLVYGRNFVGFLGLDTARVDHRWPSDIANMVRTIGEIFVSSIERKQAATALIKSQAQNQAFLFAIPDFLFLIRSDDVVVDCKTAPGYGFPIGAPEIVDRSVSDLFGVELAANVQQARRQASETGVPQYFEYAREIGDALKDFEARVAISGEDEVLLMLRDITERKRVDRMKRDFMALVSHELRTPLTSISGSLGLLTNGIGGPHSDKARNLIGIAHRNSKRLAILINDILDMEKMDSGKLKLQIEEHEINSLARQAVEELRAFADGYGVALEFKSNFEAAEVRVDSNKFVQVVSNLVSNAVKYSPTGDTVDVRTELGDGDVVLHVEDRGPGIPEEFKSRIFDKFVQVDSPDTRKKGGSGLGLAIAKSLVDRFGGEISFVSERGAGTTFSVRLPLVGATKA